MISSNSPDSPESDSTTLSSVGCDTETGASHRPPTPPLRLKSVPPSSSSPPPDEPPAATALQSLSLDSFLPSESEIEGAEVELPHGDVDPVNSTHKGCRLWKAKFSKLKIENMSVKNRLIETVAELHMVKEALEETKTRALMEKTLFEQQTASFEDRIEQVNQRLKDLLKHYQEYRRSTESEFSRLEQERMSAKMELSEVEEHYRTLLGKRRNATAEMSAPIDLPSGKVELEHYALQIREELLSTNLNCEHLRNRLDTEKAISRDQLNEERRKRLQAEQTLQDVVRDAKERIAELTRAVEAAQQSAAAKQAVERAAEKAAADAKRYQTELAEKERALNFAREEVMKLRLRAAHLKADLETSEKVSLDFVRLSQHLQVQLERQRQQTHEVRWQDPEDVTQCAGCERPFESAATKRNCRHCGAIFCPACLTKVVPPSGTRSRPAPVCDMCHTLLIKDAAPYFSSGSFSHADGDSSPGTATTLRKDR